ncbi:hypothetical protein T02_3749 [Trichinella nativa]|uniref:Uncharacterized protein n=1 Tax=Trichinella nativa TaxID=6335 RepID=A0A0V1KYD7_9BILA|nr:hypothetical protein T02_3749 [Trichinella nativa]
MMMVRLGFFQFNFEDISKFKSFDMVKFSDRLVGRQSCYLLFIRSDQIIRWKLFRNFVPID